MRLTAKQAAFAREYLSDSNGTQAAIRAGYSARTAKAAAGKLLAMPHVSDEIARLRGEATSAAVASHREACEMLTAQARGNVCDYMGADGRIDMDALRTKHPEAVASVKQRVETSKDGAVVTVTEFRLHDRTRTIERLAKLLGWDPPTRIAPTTPNGTEPYQSRPQMTPDEFAETYMEAFERIKERLSADEVIEKYGAAIGRAVGATRPAPEPTATDTPPARPKPADGAMRPRPKIPDEIRKRVSVG